MAACGTRSAACRETAGAARPYSRLRCALVGVVAARSGRVGLCLCPSQARCRAPLAWGLPVNFEVLARLRDWRELPDVSKQARAALWHLAACEGKTGEIFPSQDAIARATGWTDRAVRDALQELLSARLIEKAAAPSYERRTVTYRLGPALLAGVTSTDVVRPIRLAVKPARVSKTTAEAEESFTRFWALYPKPRQKDRKRALQAWIKISANPPMVERILAALRVQAQSPDWTKENYRYMPLPKSYINGARWEDVIDTPQPSGGSLPDATAWRRDCQHVPACASRLEHEAKGALSVSA